MKFQSLIIEKLIHPISNRHTCYRVQCFGTECHRDRLEKSATTITNTSRAVIEFCYPAIIVTGIPKCGTSAMYEILCKYPHAIRMEVKENCPFARKRSYWNYFHSLPQFSAVQRDSLIVDGCINIASNLRARIALRNPNTIYVVRCSSICFQIENAWSMLIAKQLLFLVV